METNSVYPEGPLSAIYGSHVFNDAVMRERLPKAVYKSLKKTIDEGVPLEPNVAETVANAMKDWAISKGATHFTHWFQPMTGVTAEKHDSFISPTPEGKVIMEFSGKELLKGESDASSFPSGGLRATFEARGYTAWDCTSPAFVKDNSLYIPTAFCSYTGQALDKKTPLLRSMEALNVQALRILRLFGNLEVKRVLSNMGPEQEYFLVDKDTYKKRKDLIFTGRTLFGASAPKGQELDDHYYGNIKERVSNYMKELDLELWKLGISAKTKHNEVAPGQHELAPVFNSSNIATDHNQLTMEIMKKVALHHNLICLLHEKPFAGINGSGKHNNWSLSTDDGQNLLEPGKTPEENMQFLLFLSAVIKAVDEYGDLLLLSIASNSNDHRLGGDEAPPAIVSMYLGEQLTDILEEMVTGVEKHSYLGGKMKIGVPTLPVLKKDTTDRNRTSPFAFTANKFEFRMVGAQDSIACPNYMINTIVAESLRQIADHLEKAKDFDEAVHETIKTIYQKHKRIIFNGNNYAEEWSEEAKKRGLYSMQSTVDVLPAFLEEKNLKLFEQHRVLSRDEAFARYEILTESYVKNMHIEAVTMHDMASKQILPACLRYIKFLSDAVNSLRETGLGIESKAELDLLKEVTEATDVLREKNNALKQVLAQVSQIQDSYEQARQYRQQVFVSMQQLREVADHLEELVDETYWPIPTYSDLLYNV